MKLSYLALAAGLLTAAPAMAQITATTSGVNAAANAADAASASQYASVAYSNNFNSGSTAGFSGGLLFQTGNNGTISSMPFGDTSQYAYVSPAGNGNFVSNSPVTFSTAGLGSFNTVSFLWGSIDSYNTISFLSSTGSVIASFTGTQVDAGAASATATRYVTFTGLTSSVAAISFASTQAAFEFDDFTVGTAVPEAATWAMMMVGLAVVGGSLRRKAKVSVGYAAA